MPARAAAPARRPARARVAREPVPRGARVRAARRRSPARPRARARAGRAAAEPAARGSGRSRRAGRRRWPASTARPPGGTAGTGAAARPPIARISGRPCRRVIPTGSPRRSFVAKLPSVHTTRGSISSTWRSRYSRQLSISTGSGSRLPGRPALQDVGDEDVVAGQADLGQQAVEELAGAADERQAEPVLVGPRRLADEQQVGVGVARPEDDGLARLGQLRAADAALRLLVDGLERLTAILLRGHENDANRTTAGLRVLPPGDCGVLFALKHAPVSLCGTGPILNDTITVIGRGRLGSALAAALGAGEPLGRGSDGAGAGLVLLCVPDAEIAAAAAPDRPRPPRRPLLRRHHAGAAGAARGPSRCTR